MSAVVKVVDKAVGFVADNVISQVVWSLVNFQLMLLSKTL